LEGVGWTEGSDDFRYFDVKESSQGEFNCPTLMERAHINGKGLLRPDWSWAPLIFLLCIPKGCEARNLIKTVVVKCGVQVLDGYFSTYGENQQNTCTIALKSMYPTPVTRTS
jgi:hypothetical protein